jgi:hypothetical protein
MGLDGPRSTARHGVMPAAPRLLTHAATVMLGSGYEVKSGDVVF